MTKTAIDAGVDGYTSPKLICIKRSSDQCRWHKGDESSSVTRMRAGRSDMAMPLVEKSGEFRIPVRVEAEENGVIRGPE
jgi:hypothetical protein